MNNYIWEYYQAIIDGSEVVGIWIRLLYALIITGLEDGTYFFNPKKANNAIKFVEKFCRHNKGKLAPQTIKLSLWQKAALSVIFGIVDENDKRQFREVFMVVGRKCGKTLFASAIIAYIAYIDGEYGSEIYCLAPKLDQSDLVFSAFQFTKDNNPTLERLAVDRARKGDIYIESKNTTVKKIAFNEKKADGYNPMLTVCDEMSSWVGDRGLKQYEVMLSGTGAREEPLTLSISSSGYVNEGIYDELFKRSTRVLKGDSKEKRLLPFLYMIDDVNKWDDINELRKSLPGLGVSVSVQFILDQINIARESLPKKAEFMTKFCNIKQNSSQAWLSSEAVHKASGEELTLEAFRSNYCVVGIDLSQTTDLTSACAVIEKNGEVYIISHFWIPNAKLEQSTANDGLPYADFIKRGWLSLSGEGFVDYHDVFNWITNLVQEYEILPLCVGYDRYSSQYLISDLKQFGFKTDDVYQGFNLTPAIQEFEGMLNSELVHIGDNNLLKVHLLDTAVAVDSESRRQRIVKLNKNAHIDGMAAILCALIVKQKWSEEIGAQLKNEV